MNNNIKTMKRLRHTHARFAALNLGSSNVDDPDGLGGDGAGYAGHVATPMVALGTEEDAIGVVDDKVDERPWRLPGRGRRKISGIELGERNAMGCVRWMNEKVLEHAGFQGRIPFGTFHFEACLLMDTFRHVTGCASSSGRRYF